tara:strand:- start:6013 stop:6282 length:270 start_codon:yes stop_codon:yes gene_type:complete
VYYKKEGINMMYNIKVDLKDAMKKVEKLGIKEVLKGSYWIKVIADDPDDACYAAVQKVYTTVLLKWGEENEHACEIIKNEMRIIKIDIV